VALSDISGMLARNALGKRETRALRLRNMDDQTFVEVMEVLLDLTRNAATSLRSIDASWNGITNHGASKLLEAMHHNTGIVEVRLQSNGKVGKEVVALIQQKVKRNADALAKALQRRSVGADDDTTPVPVERGA
jgi:hypothetical protein